MRHRKIAGILAVSAAALVVSGSEAAAQRHPGHHTFRPHMRVYPYYPYRFAFGFYEGFYGPPYYYYPNGSPYYAGYEAYYRERSSLRIQVKPVETEVYVDGYFAGVADDFDGFFQRLHVRPGKHEIQLYLEGCRSVQKTLYLSPGASYKIRHEMEPLGPGESAEPRPEPLEMEPEVEGPPAIGEAEGVPGPETAPAPSAEFGVLAIRTQPQDVDVLIDGRPWSSGEPSAEWIIHLPVGRHHVEIRKEGYEPFVTEVDLRPGKTTKLNVMLPPRGTPSFDSKNDVPEL